MVTYKTAGQRTIVNESSNYINYCGAHELIGYWSRLAADGPDR